MGLAGPKRRTKIGHDPNNTTWARDDSTYGSKILRAQGWKPGNYLGAQNAAHASHLTAASASHIRVALRDDNLGLGAKRGADPTQNFGLSGFQSLLGRLNGKSDVQLAADKRVEKMLHLSEKYRQMGFVKGGYLLGQDEESEKKAASADLSQPKDRVVLENADAEREEAMTEKREKKRRRDTDTEPSTAKQTKPTKKKRRRIEEDVAMLSADNDGAEPASHENASESAENHDKTKKKKSEASKEAKRQRKEEKRARKDARRLRRESSAASTAKSKIKSKSKPQSESESATGSESGSGSEANPASVPIQANSGSENSADLWKRGSGSRHAFRQRYIRQKRMAGMDPQALREILMIKS